MKKKIPWRYVSVCIFLALTVACGIMIPRVKVNYDMSKYLPEEAISKQGYDVADREFGGMHIAKIMVYTDAEHGADFYLSKFTELMDEQPGLTGVTQQAEKPAAEGETKGTALYVLTFSGQGNEPEVRAAVDKAREIAGEDAAVCGTVIDDIATNEYMYSSALLASCILVPVVILLVLLTTRSFMSLILVLATLGVSIVLNMGTNFLLGGVSFITQGIALALQLAITLDYAVFLIHEYERQLDAGADAKTAVRAAVKKSFTSVFSACLTTVAGFVALMLMRFGIGMDLGLVFIKGILFSFACVLLLLPALLVICEKAVKRMTHRPLMPKFKKPARDIFKARYVFIFLVFLLIPAILLQNNLEYRFGSAGLTAGEGVPSYDAKLEIAEVYGKDNSVMVVFRAAAKPSAASGVTMSDEQRAQRRQELALSQALAEKTFDDGTKMFNSVLSSPALFYEVQKQLTAQLAAALPDIPGASFLPNLDKIDWNLPYCETQKEYFSCIAERIAAASGLPASLIESAIGQMMTPEMNAGIAQVFAAREVIDANFTGNIGDYRRIILSANTDEESERAYAMYDAVRAAVGESGLEGTLYVGETPTAYDMREIMTRDNVLVSILSIIMVFLIIAFSFRSLSIPFLLLVPILTGIYINSAIPALMGTPIAYLGNLVVMMIHLGATIDYAILYANKYVTNRRTMDKRDSSVLALSEAIPSILTSAIALTVAGFAIGWTAVLPATAQIGLMLGRAGLLSAFFTIFVLPGILCLCDPLIRRTTWRANFFTNAPVCDIMGTTARRMGNDNGFGALSAGKAARLSSFKRVARGTQRDAEGSGGGAAPADERHSYGQRKRLAGLRGPSQAVSRPAQTGREAHRGDGDGD